MPSPEQLAAPWVDIQALPVPATATNFLSIIIAIAGGIILLLLVYFIWQRPRLQALRQLRRLQNTSLNTRQQLFLLNRILQHGLQVTSLQNKAFDSARQNDWQRFCQELVQQCYQATLPSTGTVLQLTQQARQWLKQA